MDCQHCHSENPPHFRFCGECGTPLGEQAAGSPAATGQHRTSSAQPRESEGQGQVFPVQTSPSQRQIDTGAERRHLTVMFCDLVSVAPLAGKLDPEELREIIHAYQEACTAVVRRFDGYVARYAGESLLLYFGYPRAHEDDAHRAVRTALEILTALPHLQARIQHTVASTLDLSPHVRIGIHTGLVVVGEMGTRDYRESVVLGETPNIAARLRDLAPLDGIVIGAPTYQLVEGLFTCHDQGDLSLKGVSAPIHAYRVEQETEAQSRFEVALTTGLSPFVGRERELDTILSCWERVQTGNGQIVLICGEAGIGKSRLVQSFRERLADEDYIYIKGRCSPYAQNSAFHPVIGLLQQGLQFSRADDTQTKLHKLEHVLERAKFPLEKTVPLFASLLSIPLSDAYDPSPLSPLQRRQQLLQVLLTWLLSLAKRKPIVLVGEDLHWMDPSSLELLALFLKHIAQARILLILTFRPEFQPSWDSLPYQAELTLHRLPQPDVRTMLERLTEGTPLPTEIVEQLVNKTDGVPLFVEELTKMVLESGLLKKEGHRYILTQPLPPLAIPVTLHDSLLARLDRLATAKETAQRGAVLGREFTYELIAAVSPPTASIRRDLALLVEAELLYQRGTPPKERYVFKHVLVQEAAYQSLLKSTRQHYHQHIAQVLEARFPDLRESQPELLAHHYTEALLPARALPYWQQAGRIAVERSAHMEACRHFTQGITLLTSLPDSPDRARQELSLQIALGGPLIASKGYGAPEVERVYARAQALCQQLGDSPRLLQVLLGLEAFYFIRAELRTAQQLAERCWTLVEHQQDPVRRLPVHWALGQVLFHRGQFAPALAQVEHGLTLYSSDLHQPRALQDSGVMCFAYAALTRLCLGYSDRAWQTTQQMLTLARTLGHRFSLAFALNMAATVSLLRQDWDRATALGLEAVELCREQGFPVWLAYARILVGWLSVRQGHGEEYLTQMLQGVSAWQATGAEATRSFLLSLVAGAYGRSGQPARGLQILDDAIMLAQTSGELYCLAELWQLKGGLTLQEANQKAKGKRQKATLETAPQPLPPNSQGEAEQEAEGYFLKALEIARHQQAKSWELRVALSLGRLWARQGKHSEAQQLVSEVLAWFTEGFDTTDVQEAQRFLATGDL
ncbi:MAG: adenylate/guanylate cyclase domain-containing protein [Deltaproteobacteria bacterium]|nr:adenylate/guanylate cyclase domain-containing protein [Deltaproteobacteria bacterium]